MGYTATFKSLAGKTCVITIGGGGTPLIAAASPFSWDETNSDDLLNVVRHRSGYINLSEDSFGALDDLHPAHSTDLPLAVSYDGVTVFNGFLQAQSFSNPFAPGPNVVSIPIVSPLGVAAERTLTPRKVAENYTGAHEISLDTGDLQNYLGADGKWATATSANVGRFVEITPGSKYLVTSVNAGRVALTKTTSNVGGASADFATGCGVVEVSGGGQTVLSAPSDAHYMYVAMTLSSASTGTRVVEQPTSIVGVETIGSVMKEICTALGISSIIIPKALLQDNVNPMHVYVSKCVLSPYNSEFNFGENDLFSPITYETFLMGVCNLYGLVVHDTVDANGDSVLTFGKVGYTGKWLKMAVSTLDDTSVTGTESNQPSATIFNNYEVASDNGQMTYVRPIGRLDIDNGDKVETVNAAFDHFEVLSSGSAIHGFHAVPLSDGGEFLSQYLVDYATWRSEYNPIEGNVVGLFGDGEEKIGIKYRAPGVSPPSYTPLFEYVFSEWPRSKFDVLMETESGLFSYRIQIESGGKYVGGTGTKEWVDVPTFLSLTNNTSNEYVIDDIPKTDYPVIVRIYPNPAQSSGLDIVGDPVTRLALTVKEASPMNKYLVNLGSTIRTIKHSGEYENDSISCLFHDYIDNPGRIIGGSLEEQDNYDYMFSAMRVLKVSLKRTSESTLDLSRMYMQNVTVGDESGWRVLSVGFDTWNDVFDFTLFKVADASSYFVVTDLENVTSDAPSTVDIGGSLSVTLTGIGSNKVQENSVVVLMGGVDITSTAYNHSTKTVTIAEVTGNVSITAVGRPYDAEVEYLQSSGTQYIDTGVKPTNNYTFDTKVAATVSNNNCTYWGCRSSGTYSSSNSQCYLNSNTSASNATNKKIRLVSTSNSSTANWNSGITPTTGEMYNLTGITVVSTMNTMTYPVTLFALNNIGTISCSSCRIGGWTAYESGTKVMDLISVRDNGVGYMYDKVSGTFYGNAGTGSFTYGNDV